MVGLWRVQAEGEAQSTALRLGGAGLVLWRRCATMDGNWRATIHGEFLGDLSGVSYRCTADKAGSTRTPEWMRRAATYQVAGQNRQLLDEHGTVVATLLPGARPPADPAAVKSFPKPPAGEELEGLKKSVARAKPSPPPLKAPTREGLLGTWYPESPAAEQPPSRPRLEVKADGTWHASDGCNGTGGRWSLGVDGALLASGGGQTLIGCFNDDSGMKFAMTARVGLDGQVLVLLDANGKQLSRLVRA